MKLGRVFLVLGALSIICLVGALMFKQPLQVGYHHWRMNADFDRVFGKMQSNGVSSSVDVSKIDVDRVLASYESHRDSLVSLGAYSHLTGSFPWLVSDGSIKGSEKRSEFAERLAESFPGYRFYHLKEDGAFSVWVPIEDKDRWQGFIESEIE